MEHLIELRSRLIKALVAFFLAAAFCFFFAKHDLQHQQDQPNEAATQPSPTTSP